MTTTEPIEDWEKEEQEFKNDCNRIRYGIFSNNGYTRYNSKREAELALEKMLDSWRDKRSKNLVKTINPDASIHTDSIRREINLMVDTNCKQCGQPTVAQSEYYAKYQAECNECNKKRRKREHEEYCNKKREEIERNPLIKYCYEIRHLALPYEIPIKTKIEEYDFLHEKYDPKECGMSKAQWEEERKHKKWLIKERKKEYEVDRNLQCNSPTGQILTKLQVVRSNGCECKAEYMRLGQFCPVCRLMIKVYEYALNLFKDAAEGRTSPSTSFFSNLPE